MKIIKIIFRLLRKINPRYQLSLDSHFYNLSTKEIVYRFKVFGEHTFPKFTFQDIKNNKRLMYDINPIDLMKITIDDYIDSQRKSMLKITEILRDNKYRLSDSNSNEIFSGEEICDNVLLMEKIKNIDLYKIVYSTAFKHGRQFSKEIIQQSTNNKWNENIFPLKSIDNGK
ncbi:MAG: hypothetical protein JO149_07020 [Gammaproteobacteria bacterium]|nr:hypothetical protein [Gammaproteobacteria bacterium]